MARARGIFQLIQHLSHLTPVGWGYLACSVLCSALVYQSSKRITPFVVRKQAKHSYPSFEWIVVPQYGMPLSLALLPIAFFFLGYFCDSGAPEDDIYFFKILSGIFILFLSVPTFFDLLNIKCFMRNNGIIYISRFAPLGLYERISINYLSVIEDSPEKENSDEHFVSFQYNKGKFCRLNLKLYSSEGQVIIKKILHLTT